ncbi:MAG: mechanosensitive ion channel [Alphaproteobacteria bacterium]|nr:mechanosensitive ion channel [Alphaproteobacteria bacterium]
MDHEFQQLTAWAGAHVRLEAVLGTLALVIFGGAVILTLTRVLRSVLRRVDPRLHVPYDTMLLVLRFVAGALWVLLGLVILEFWGVSVGGLWTFLASVGTLVGVGFLATWAMISNATANLFITIWRPFRLGQDVELLPENLKGRVIDRNLMFTALREQSGTILQIPNNLFFQKMFRVTATEQYLFEFLEHETERDRNPGGSPGVAAGGGAAGAPDR